jgi:hypothetical protein
MCWCVCVGVLKRLPDEDEALMQLFKSDQECARFLTQSGD